MDSVSASGTPDSTQARYLAAKSGTIFSFVKAKVISPGCQSRMVWPLR